MSERVTPYYTKMPQADLDAFVAIIEANGVSDSIRALADYVTQRGLGEAGLAVLIGAAMKAAQDEGL